METKAELREADPQDQPVLDIVRRQAIEIGLSGTYNRNDFADLVAEPDPRLGEWIEDDNTLVLVLGDEMTPFAYGVYDRSRSKIMGLYTGETYRDEGHASRIVNVFEQEARDRKKNDIRVDSPRNAVEFFENLDFQIYGTTTPSQIKIPLKRMKKKLTDGT